MKRRSQSKFILACTSYLAFVLAFHQFFVIYTIDNQLAKYFGIGLIAATALLFPSKFVRFIFYVLSLFINLLLLFPFPKGGFTRWLDSFISQLDQVYELFLHRGVGHQFTTVVVVILIVVSILLMELLVEYEQVVISIGMIVLYLLMLAIQNEQDFSVAIILVMAIGIFQKYSLTRTQKSEKIRLKSLGQMGLLLGALTVVSIFLPNEVFKKPIFEQSTGYRNFLQEKEFYNYIQQSGRQITIRTGYSENSEQLGGPILEDHQVVFEATQKTSLPKAQASNYYWRIDSKTIYTGLGWIDSGDAEAAATVKPLATEMEVDDSEYAGQVTTEETIRLHFDQSAAYVPIPYGKTTLSIEKGGEGFTYYPDTRRVDTINYSEQRVIKMDIQSLRYTNEELSSIKPLEEVPRYLQLPEELPIRVHELAQKTVEGKQTMIDQVTAIESFLKSSGNYRYSKIDAVYTNKGKDYVDQFLFESKVGYCDNFSTSMVILLRTLGIPARWVKGFAPGEVTQSETDKEAVKYTVRNTDAHSWVEVYFDGYGWLPFEPTPSFTQPLQELSRTNQTSSTTQQSENSSSERTTPESTSTTSSKAQSTPLTDETKPTNITTHSMRPLLVVGLIICFAVGSCLVYREQIFWMMCLRVMSSADPLNTGYLYLLKKLNRLVPRAEGQTLQIYAQKVEEQIPQLNQAFSKLTVVYETSLYSTQKVADQRKLLKQIAKELSHWRFQQIGTRVKQITQLHKKCE
ncbi:hypothetical protein IGI37_000723 [Enterococcus sp. AZ194]|uniref:DUF4129 domain-containing transglutaminase family protein n=1 Tax=Enterococcus sp. AZ194 TaxID=2774629 RepID=UPI003F23E3F5